MSIETGKQVSIDGLKGDGTITNPYDVPVGESVIEIWKKVASHELTAARLLKGETVYVDGFDTSTVYGLFLTAGEYKKVDIDISILSSSIVTQELLEKFEKIVGDQKIKINIDERPFSIIGTYYQLLPIINILNEANRAKKLFKKILLDIEEKNQ